MSGPAEDDHPHPHDHGAPGEPPGAGDDPAPGEADEGPPDISGWIAAAPREACPACGAPGAVRLGGGVFCPSCGETTTSAGYLPPAPPPRPDDDAE